MAGLKQRALQQVLDGLMRRYTEGSRGGAYCK